MKRVLLFHKDPGEVDETIRELNKAGYRIVHADVSPSALRGMKENPPFAVIIDLTHAPSRGRDVGIYFRHYKSTRGVPIVFVGGAPEKVVDVKKHLPDAMYTDWRMLKRDLKRAILNPPAAPTAPGSLLAGYSDTPLVRKLGIKPRAAITLIGAPHDFEKMLISMARGVAIRRRFGTQKNLIIWFVASKRVLQNRIDAISKKVGDPGLWIVWPKRGSHISSDLTQRSVRAAGLNHGLVDYKVCAIDDKWSGLKFSIRKIKR
ncbi:MAG: hypothetical protein JSU64_06920 [candidate division WOR-3 bacterium]|nr:MAG: hypothetical protein JSU64_06920 [candidate division WOR-3 bacterium]